MKSGFILLFIDHLSRQASLSGLGMVRLMQVGYNGHRLSNPLTTISWCESIAGEGVNFSNFGQNSTIYVHFEKIMAYLPVSGPVGIVGRLNILPRVNTTLAQGQFNLDLTCQRKKMKAQVLKVFRMSKVKPSHQPMKNKQAFGKRNR